MQKLENAIAKSMEELKIQGVLTGVRSGFYSMDRITHGFQNGELTIIAARPGMGKRLFALNIAHHLTTETDKRVAIFSLEQSEKKVTKDILNISLATDEFKFETINEKVKYAAIYIDTPQTISIMELMERAATVRYNEKIDIIIIDYLQLITDFEFNAKKNKQDFTLIARLLKNLAQSLNIPIVVLSQLTSKTENRKNKKPILSDLDDFGMIEKYADLVLFLFRWDYYHLKQDWYGEETKDKTLVIISKNRCGSLGETILKNDFRINKFSEQ